MPAPPQGAVAPDVAARDGLTYHGRAIQDNRQSSDTGLSMLKHTPRSALSFVGLVTTLFPCWCLAEGFQAGASRVDITPEAPIRLSGNVMALTFNPITNGMAFTVTMAVTDHGRLIQKTFYQEVFLRN